jgi:hypothetical protein
MLAFAKDIRHRPGDSLGSDSCSFQITSPGSQPQGSKLASPSLSLARRLRVGTDCSHEKRYITIPHQVISQSRQTVN